MNPGEKWPPEESTAEPEATPSTSDGEVPSDGEGHEMPAEFVELVTNSSLVPAICSYLRNDSGMLTVNLANIN